MVTRALIATASLLALVTACTAEPSPTFPAADQATALVPPGTFASAPVGPPLAPQALITRLSIDLRGVRPTPEELEVAVGGDEAIAALVEQFLASPRFPERIRDLWAVVLRTRVEDFPIPALTLGFTEGVEPALFASIGEEPLHVIARIAAEDRPWTQVVTADWTMADSYLAAIWPLDRGPEDLFWREARYTDGRPAAGVLSTNGLWWRYLSDGVSYGRGRANAIARVFLCADFLDRPVDFPRDIDLTDEVAIAQAVRENTGCVGCHSALDPLASYLAGFEYAGKTGPELSSYHPERESSWHQSTQRPPSFYGQPGYTLSDLGQQVAADPRFVQCAVQRTFELLVGRPTRPLDKEERDALTRHREAFLAGGLTMKALIRSIVTDPRYREAPNAQGGERLVTPEIWADQLEAFTGYRLTAGGADLLATDKTGLRTLAGGGDGRAGAAPAVEPTTTMVLVWKRTAEAAAAYAVAHWQDEPRLFERDPNVRPAGKANDDEGMRTQVVALHRRLFGTAVAAESLEVSALLELWDGLSTMGTPASAWSGVLTALLRDPSLVVY